MRLTPKHSCVLKNKGILEGKFWVGSCWMNRSSSDKRRRSFQAMANGWKVSIWGRLWNVTRAEVVGEQVEGGWSNWFELELWRKGDVPLRISVWGPGEEAGAGGRYWRFKRVRTCSKSCTRVGRMGRMWEDGLGCENVDSACEDGKVRDQMIVDRNLEVDWKQEGHFSGGPVGKTCLSIQGRVRTGSILRWGANIPHAFWPKNPLDCKRQKQYCNSFKTDF